MGNLKKKIDLQPLKDEEIAKANVSLGSLWMVKDHHDKIYGPYQTDTLKEYIFENNHLFAKTKIYNLESEKWHSTFDLPVFQRRKDPNKPDELFSGNEFFIYLNNQKSGPYTKDEVQNFLNNGHLKTTSLISLDKGANWIKLFEHHAFDRRETKSNQELPFVPDQSILDQMALKKEEILKLKDSEDAISQLAYLSQHKEDEKNTNTTKSPKADSNFGKHAKVIFGVVSSFAVVIFLALQLIGQAAKEEPAKFSSSQKIEQTKKSMAKKIEPKSPQRSPAKIVPKKFKKKSSPKLKPRRFQSRTTRRKIQREPEPIRREEQPEIEQTYEEVDINDPQMQRELTRQLAGENKLDEPYYDEYDEPEPPIDEEAPYDDYMGEEEPLELEYEEY